MASLPGDIAAALETVASAHRRLAAENVELRAELLALRGSALGGCAASLFGSGAMSPASSFGGACIQEAHVVRTVYGADEQRLIDERRNEDRARLQRLLADLDPEASGDWATQPLTVEGCHAALRTYSGDELPEDVLQEVVEHLTAYASSCGPPAFPTKGRLIDLTTGKQIRDVFGEALIGSVMRLQDAVMQDVEDEVTRATTLEFTRTPTSTPTRCFRFCMKVVRPHTRFAAVERVAIALVIINTLLLGISTDLAKNWWGWDWISAVFAVLFVAELVLRIVVVGGVRRFFTGKHVAWNIFDTSLIALALLDIVILAVSTGSSGNHISRDTLKLVRIARLARLTRIARLAKTGVFHEFTHMLRSIIAGASTMLWALALLMITCYIGAIFLTQTIGRELDPDFKPYADMHFANVTDSMFTLFRCVNGDCSSFDGKPLSSVLMQKYGHVVKVLYGLVVMIVSFGLVNIMVASFLQSSMGAAKFNDFERRHILAKERKMVQQKTSALFRRLRELYMVRARPSQIGQTVLDMRISREMFAEFLCDREIQQWLENMGCDDSLRRRLFDKIDRDCDGVLGCAELVTGIVDLLRGRFDSLEVLTVQVRGVAHKLRELEAAVLAQNRGGSPSSAKTAY